MHSKVTSPHAARTQKLLRNLGLAGGAGLTVLLLGWAGPILWHTRIIDLLALVAYLVALFGTAQQAASAVSAAGFLGLLIANAVMAFRVTQVFATSGSSGLVSVEVNVGRGVFWWSTAVLLLTFFVDIVLFVSQDKPGIAAVTSNLECALLGAGFVGVVVALTGMVLMFSRDDNFEVPLFIGRANRAKLCALTGVLAPCFLVLGPSLANFSAFVALVVLLHCNRNLHKVSL